MDQRLFVAFELPDRVHHEIGEALEPWRDRLKGVRWGPSENWHATLLFLGATDPDRIPWIEGRLTGVARVTRPPATRLTGFGAFPSAMRASVLWVGLADDEGHIARLASAVAVALDAELEHEPFSAHVTVGRARRPIRLTPAFTTERVDSDPFEVRELVLFRSHLGGGQPRYEPLDRFPCRSPR